ncbi:NIPSNAP family protein [Chloroflexota bacterium]
MIYFQTNMMMSPGKSQEFNEILGQHLAPVMDKYGGKLIGSWETAVGTLNEITDLWAFNSMGHFEEAMKSFGRDPELRPYLITLQSLVVSETMKLLRPLPCSPLK